MEVILPISVEYYYRRILDGRYRLMRRIEIQNKMILEELDLFETENEAIQLVDLNNEKL